MAKHRKTRLKQKYTREATAKLRDRLYKTRDFKWQLELAIETVAWSILRGMEGEVECKGIPLCDVLYPAVENVAKKILRQKI